MPGYRQHFLPRFLKKGFASKIVKKEIYTWVFVPDQEPYETNLLNIGLEKFFYGKPDESDVDNIITSEEGEFTQYLDGLRKIKITQSLEGELPAKFIVHLILRTKHLRESVQEAGTTLFSIIEDSLKTPEDFTKIISNQLTKNPQLFEESIRKELVKRVPPGTPHILREVYIKKAMSKLPEILPDIAHEGHIFFSGMLAKLKEEMATIVKNAHNKSLSHGGTASKAFVKKFEYFQWSLIVNEKDKLILGDIGPIARFSPDNKFKPVLHSEGEFIQVLLPISDQHLIIGNSTKELPLPSHEEINEISASLSKNYFIGSRKSDTEIGLSSIIGMNSFGLSDETILEIENKINKEWVGRVK